MRRLRSRRGGAALTIALAISGIISLVAAGFHALAEYENRAQRRTVNSARGRDLDQYAVELANQLKASDVFQGFRAPLYDGPKGPATFWIAVPSSGANWTFTPGFPKDLEIASFPVATLNVGVCDVNKTTKTPPYSFANLVASAYIGTPRWPAACPITNVPVVIFSAKDGQYVELFSAATVAD